MEKNLPLDMAVDSSRRSFLVFKAERRLQALYELLGRLTFDAVTKGSSGSEAQVINEIRMVKAELTVLQTSMPADPAEAAADMPAEKNDAPAPIPAEADESCEAEHQPEPKPAEADGDCKAADQPEPKPAEAAPKAPEEKRALFCTKCGAKLLEGAGFCTKCGAKAFAFSAEQAAPEPEPQEKPASAPAPEPNVLPDPSQSLSTPQKPRFCTSCGSKLREGYVFCTNCGKRL